MSESLLEVLNRYFDALSSGGANLPDGSDSPYERSTETPPHSSDTRGTSVERLNGTKVIRAMNEDGRCTMILCTDNGQVINMDETGNIFIGAGKIGDDETGGQLTLRPWGDMTVKTGGKLSIEVENFDDEKKALSLQVNGDINVVAEGSNAFIRGKNITLRADNDLNLAGSKVNIQGGQNKGGAVSLVANTFKTDTTFIKHEVSGGMIANVAGEYTVRQITDPRAIFTLSTVGHMKVNVIQGDMSFDVGGRMEMNVAGTPPKPISIVKNPASLSLTVAAGNMTQTVAVGNMTEKYAGVHTVTVEGKSAITRTGNVTKTYSGNETTTIAGNSLGTYQGKRTLNVTGDSSETFQGKHSENTTGAATYTAQGAMVLRADGTMTIAGAVITLN